MNRENSTQDSKVLQILDDIDRIKSCEFSQESVSDMLKTLEQQLGSSEGGEVMCGRSISNDDVQAYLGKAVDDAVQVYLGPPVGAIEDGPSPSPQGPKELDRVGEEERGKAQENLLPIEQGSLKWLTPNSTREPSPSPSSSTQSVTQQGSMKWLTPDARSEASPSPSSGTKSVTPPPSDDEHDGRRDTTSYSRDVLQTKMEGAEAKATSPTLNPIKSSAARPADEVFAAFRNEDVLFGRGGLSNHHAGNKRYREEVDRLKPLYRQSHLTKKQKTEIRNRLVDTVRGYGGRFMKYSDSTGWEEVPLQQARKKASQALREDKRKGGTN